MSINGLHLNIRYALEKSHDDGAEGRLEGISDQLISTVQERGCLGNI